MTAQDLKNLGAYKFRVTFFSRPSKYLAAQYENTELHRSESDYKLRASALNWGIVKVEAID